MSAHPSAPVICFGAFEVNFQTGELHHKGQKVKLQEQPLQILATLLERPGEIVTREELCKKLCSEDTFVDVDHSLNAAIKRLRGFGLFVRSHADAKYYASISPLIVE